MKTNADRLIELLGQTAESKAPGAWADFLKRVCQDEPALRERLEELLRGNEEAGASLNASEELQEKGLASQGKAPPPRLPMKAQPSLNRAGEPGDALTSNDLARPTPNDQPGHRIGRYKLLQKIGEGGCGTVYMAEQFEPVRRRVALKVIKLGMDTKQVIARFEAERQALAVMDHANIAQVFDAGTTDTGRPYFVMELVRGVPITQFCTERQLSLPQRLDLFVQVCRAIQHAHQKGIIHRDIKPSNILVSVVDDKPVPKVIDFGIAKATAGTLTDRTLFTALEQFIGTPAYMSPEQAELRLDIDTRSDIYSLGVVLYELLTGRTPFDSKALLQRGIEELINTLREVEPPRPSVRLSTLAVPDLEKVARSQHCDPSTLSHTLRGDLDWIAMKCLEKDRTRRYETANALGMDIQRYLNHEPVVARPAGRLYRFRKLVRRNQLVFAATGAVALALVLGLALSTWQYLQKNRAYNLAVVAEQKQAQERRRAERISEVSHERAVRLNVAYGVRLMEMGDLLSSLQWFIEALGLTEGDPVQESIHRVRIGAVLRQCPQLLQIWWHASLVQHTEFSPDGQRIVTAHEDGTAQVWDVNTGRKVGQPLRHNDAVNWATFSPDSRLVATASADSTAQVWDAVSGQPVAPAITHPGKVVQVAFGPDGKRLLVGGDDGTLRVWDFLSGRPLTPPMRHSGAITEVGFSPDGQRAVSASADGTAKVWDAITGTAVGSPLRHEAYVVRASFSPDGHRVVTASRDGTARIWDATTGEPLTQPLRHLTWLTDARFNPDNSTVATASFDNTARIWDAETGKPVCSPLRHGHSVMSSAFSPDGRRLITACFNQTAQVWDADTGELLVSPLKHSGYVSEALFSPGGRRILTSGFDRAMRLWDIATRDSLVARLDLGAAVSEVAFSGDGRLLATVDTNRVVRFWNVDTGHRLPTLVRHAAAVRTLAFVPNGKQILIADEDGTAQLFEPENGQPVGKILRLAQAIDVAGFSPDSRRVFLGAHTGVARVWNTTSGEPLSPLLQLTNGVRLVAFNSDGTRMVAVDSNQFARVWDTSTARPISPPVGHPTEVFSAAFSPDSHKVVTSCSDDTLSKLSAYVWDAVTGVALTPPLQHEDGVQQAYFSPDGRSIVTASEDGTAGIWDAETGRLRAPFLRHNYQVHYATFSPDGRFIATASRDLTARVWDARTGEPVTPPLRHADRVFFATFNLAGDRLATRSRDGRAFLWDLTQENRSVAELTRLGQLLNSRQIDSSGGALPVDTGTLENIWRQLKRTSAVATDPQKEVIQAWHEREATECEASHRWFVAVFHLRRLVELDPLDTDVAARLVLAEKALAEEEQDRAKGGTSGRPQK